MVPGSKKKAEVEKKKEISMEDKFYWVRTFSGIIFAFFGRYVFHLIGRWMLLYLVLCWFGFPWIMSFVIFRIPYEKEKCNWKMIMKTGICAFFFMFMLTATIIHTLMVFPQYAEIFANPE